MIDKMMLSVAFLSFFSAFGCGVGLLSGIFKK